MANASPTSRPSWQRSRVFRFFSSLKLAVVLLAVLIIGAIAGTLYESTFDAKVARAYVYGAPWFNLWLLFLAANLIVSALSPWPWKIHHVSFLITHLGIITLLTGSLIGRVWGIEGTITLFKGEPPTDRLLVDQHQLRVRDTDGILKGYAAEFIHRPPTPQKPWDLGTLAGGARLSIVDYAPAIEGKLDPKSLQAGGTPAFHFTIATKMMGQKLESWLMADDRQHGSFNMGLATIELKRGTAPNSAAETKSSGEVEIEEAIFAFEKAPEEQIARVVKGGSSGAKVQWSPPSRDGGRNKGSVIMSLNGKTWTFEVAQNLGKDAPLDGTAFMLRIDNYWPDFRIENGKPTSLSDQPNNPAVVVTISGRGVAAATSPESHGTGKQVTATGGPPAMPAHGEETPNHLTLFIADDGAITYELASRKNGKSPGKIELNKPLPTGWADWQLVVDQTMPSAQAQMDFTPVKSGQTSASLSGAADLPDGVRLRVQQNGETIERWAPAGWQITIPTSPSPTLVAYGWKTVSLPIGLELLNFEVKRNEGSDSPAGFKSTLQIATVDGETATGSCWMNNPFSYPGTWWHTWTGLTYKISQASWNPENLRQSTVQILRDPGWLLKWIGSLLVVIGVFMMFYLQPYRKQTEGEPITP